MRTFLLASICVAVGGVLFSQSGHPLVEAHTAKLQKLDSLSLKVLDTEIGGGSTEETLMISKPNKLRWESDSFLIIADGTTIHKLDKAKNSYDESPQADGWEALLKSDTLWPYSAFFVSEFPKKVGDAKDGGTRKIKNQMMKEVSVAGPGPKAFTLLFDEKAGMFRGAQYAVEISRAQVGHLVVVTPEDDQTIPASAYTFTAPAGAVKVVPEEVQSYTYADVKPILDSNCAGCHGGGNPKAGVDLSSYQGAMRIVTAGAPNQSRLIRIIRSGKMPPGGRLPDASLKKLSDWIQGGAKEQ